MDQGYVGDRTPKFFKNNFKVIRIHTPKLERFVPSLLGHIGFRNIKFRIMDPSQMLKPQTLLLMLSYLLS